MVILVETMLSSPMLFLFNPSYILPLLVYLRIFKSFLTISLSKMGLVSTSQLWELSLGDFEMACQK